MNGWKERLHPNLPTTPNRCAGALRDFGDRCSCPLDGRRCSGLPLCRAWILFLHFSSPTTRLRMRPSYLLEKFIILKEIYGLFREYHKIELFKILRSYSLETINKTLIMQAFLPQIFQAWRAQIARFHRAAGHPIARNLARMLQDAQVEKWKIKEAFQYRCPVCEEHKPGGKSSRQVAPMSIRPLPQPWEHLGIDITEWEVPGIGDLSLQQDLRGNSG